MNRWTISLVAVVLSGCGDDTSPPPSPVNVGIEVLYRGARCPEPMTEGNFFAVTAATIGRFSGAVSGNSLGGSAQAIRPPVEGRETFVWVDLGARPTAGYSVGLRGSEGSISEGVLVLEVDYREPAPDMIVAQVITRPCLLVGVASVGITDVQLVDETQRSLLEGPIVELVP